MGVVTDVPRRRLSLRMASTQPVMSRRSMVAAGIGVAAVILALGVTVAPPALLVAATIGIGLAAAVAVYPPFGVYLLIGVTPLLAGMERGSVIPVLRPNEALDVLIGAGLIAGGLVRMRSRTLPRLKLGTTDRTILLLAAASSILPLMWMLLRGLRPESDDILYSLMIWKYFGVYLIAKVSIRDDHQMKVCLWISMIAASVVAAIAICQSLHIGAVTAFLGKYYVSYGYTASISNGRGGSTLGLPIAVADLMTLNLAIAVGFLLRHTRHKAALGIMSALFLVGALSAGEFSGAMGVVFGVVVIAAITRRLRQMAALFPALLIGAMVLRPVIETRLAGFNSVSGVPVSWTGRWTNLTNYFFPPLFGHANFILGVRPAARVATASRAAGFVWIESGYTWLLWAGGIPLLAAFVYFLWKNLRFTMPLARVADDATGVAALAVATGLWVIGVLMTLDPHLTYRGSADLLFALLGLVVAGSRWTTTAKADAPPAPDSLAAASRVGM
jgi:hypothetical protein